ncbi:MAG TPA: radical SAM family heme chaperone HemW [Candidatus Baltobacteraceae bacterium]|nr:radical SAM family heme chaperone HemW [Candidatus Baltobacteraceae bacterium]
MTSAVYVHLPFCPYICPYCDFAKWPHKQSAAARYLQALHAEIERYSRHFGQSAAQYATVFLGGGTPNTYAAADIATLLEMLRRCFSGPSVRETTIEVNPELVALEDLIVYRQAGVTRLSIGVQSFVPDEIRVLGRRHTTADVDRVVAHARAAGIPSVSVDLMFAVPAQTPASWRRSLDQAIELGVDHISTYGLTIEPGTPFQAWRDRDAAAFFDDGAEAQLYEIAIETLARAGYEQYEISNFARPGHRSRHNANYWDNGEYAGLGVGAASYADGVRSVHTRDLESYVQAALAGAAIPGEAERLEGAKQAGEAAMLALRTSQGVCFEAFKERYGVDFLKFYAPVLQRHGESGFMEIDATHARLTLRGRFMANDVCADFVTFA